MGVCLNLKYVKDFGGGKYQFLKPYPPSLRAALGQQLKITHKVLNKDQASKGLAEHIAAKYPTAVAGFALAGITAQDASLLDALTNPTTTPPEPTLRDAVAFCLMEQVGDHAKPPLLEMSVHGGRTDLLDDVDLCAPQ